jgi:hypothetical protein
MSLSGGGFGRRLGLKDRFAFFVNVNPDRIAFFELVPQELAR